MPYADPAKQKEASRRWYEKNREVHIARSKARAQADPERHRNAVYKHRALYGRRDRPFVSDAERIHNYKPLQRWLEQPKLSPSIVELVRQAEAIWHEKEEKRKLAADAASKKHVTNLPPKTQPKAVAPIKPAPAATPGTVPPPAPVNPAVPVPNVK